MSNTAWKALRTLFVAAAVGTAPQEAKALDPDVKLHMGASYLLYCGSKNAFDLSDNQAAAVSLGVGVFKELVYDRVKINGKRGDPSWKDMGYDVAGNSLAYATCPNLRGGYSSENFEAKPEKLALDFSRHSPHRYDLMGLSPRLKLTPELSVGIKRGGVFFLYKKEFN